MILGGRARSQWGRFLHWNKQSKTFRNLILKAETSKEDQCLAEKYVEKNENLYKEDIHPLLDLFVFDTLNTI